MIEEVVLVIVFALLMLACVLCVSVISYVFYQLLAKKIMQMNIVEKRAIFGEIGRMTYAVISELSASEVIEKLKAYEEQKKHEEDEKIKVGDEVYTEDKEIKFVVTGIGEESAHLVDCNGNFSWTKTYCLNKTGRHFHEIENVLEKLKEGNNG